MNEMFSQGGKGSTGILTNKQAIARKFGVKQNEVVYFAVGVDLGGYKVIYDKTTQRTYSLPALATGITAVSLTADGTLVHSAGSVDLGELAVNREEYITLPGSFATGATLIAKNELLIHTTGKYRWDGEFPKIVSSGSTPETSGGIGIGAWVSVGDASLRADLSLDTGSTLIGYKGSTVSGAIDLLTSKKVYAADFGVKADGSDDTAALQALSVAVSAMTDPVVEVVFPQGVSRVGYQDQAPTTTSGYSFRPGYVATNGNVGWFFVNGRSGTTIINARGWTIKLNDGMKHGAFDPSTGLAHASTSPFRDSNYYAYAGNLVAFKGCEHVIRIGLTVRW